MVSSPLIYIVSSSLVITIACTITVILRLSSDSDGPSSKTWGAHDFFSKDSTIQTPTSGDLLQTIPSLSTPFYVPSNDSYLAPAISLAYIFTALNASSSGTKVSPDENIGLVNSLSKDLGSNTANGTAWANLILTVRSNLLPGNNSEAAIVSSNGSSTTSIAVDQQQLSSVVSFVERSVSLDSAPVMVFLKQRKNGGNNNNNGICVWNVIVGFTSDSFLVADPTKLQNDLVGRRLVVGTAVPRSEIYDRWSCQDGANLKMLKNLAIAFRGGKV